jgi:hypothetical protein
MPLIAEGGPAQVAAAPAEAMPVDGWSRTAFQSYRDGSWDIFAMRPNGAELRKLTTGAGSDGRPEQCRGNGRIVFVSNRTGNFEVFTMAPDGSDLRQVTFNPADDNYPTWSPDCKRIAFATANGDDWDIFVADANGSNGAKLIGTPDIEFSPAWSPDGQWIAWVTLGEMQARIWIAHPDGAGLRAVSSEIYFAENLAWSPDSKRIGFDKITGWNQNFTDIGYVEVSGSEWSWPNGIYAPKENYTDALMGGWSPDGKEILMTLVKYRLVDNEWFMESAHLARANQYGGYEPTATLLPGSGLDMHGDWQRTDFTPPATQVNVPLLGGPDGAWVSWTITEGESGVVGYDFEVREENGAWFPWHYVGDHNREVVYGAPGERRYARVRARDAAGNVEPWPTSPQGDGSILFYQARYAGFTLDNRHQPVAGAAITGITNPAAPFLSAADGSYDAYTFGPFDWFGAEAQGFASPPLISTGRLAEGGHNFYLTGKTEAVQNGGFEQGLQGWQIIGDSSVITGEQGGAPIHSGEKSVLMGNNNAPITHAIAQTITVPAASLNPTLSFVLRTYYNGGQLDRVFATITETGGAAHTLDLHRSTARDWTEWTHLWADLSAWGGKRVVLTLEFRMQPSDQVDTVIIDEVSVSEWRTPRILSVDAPTHLPAALTVHGRNFEPGAVIRLGERDLPTTFVDSETLTAQVAPGAKLGPQPLRVTNPGGQQALTRVTIGFPVLLPAVSAGRR